jgi:hypothetical protein
MNARSKSLTLAVAVGLIVAVSAAGTGSVFASSLEANGQAASIAPSRQDGANDTLWAARLCELKERYQLTDIQLSKVKAIIFAGVAQIKAVASDGRVSDEQKQAQELALRQSMERKLKKYLLAAVVENRSPRPLVVSGTYMSQQFYW